MCPFGSGRGILSSCRFDVIIRRIITCVRGSKALRCESQVVCGWGSFIGLVFFLVWCHKCTMADSDSDELYIGGVDIGGSAQFGGGADIDSNSGSSDDDMELFIPSNSPKPARARKRR